MRNVKHTIFSLIVVMLFFTTYTLIEADEAPEGEHINTYHEDVTGDSHKETISLYGTPLADDSEYYQDLWAIITFPDHSEEKISYKGGYDPDLNFVDLNQDDTNDILFSGTVSQKEDLRHYQLNTVENQKPVDIDFPTQDHINGFFKDQFTVELQISPTEDDKTVDVRDRANKYVEAGIYNEEGKVQETTSVHPQEEIEYEPVFLSSNKGYGLKSTQRINGINKSDKLGTIETLWYHKEDKWIILQSKWISASES